MRKRHKKKTALAPAALTAPELRILCGTINEVLDLYEGDQLHARLGTTEAGLTHLSNKLNALLQKSS